MNASVLAIGIFPNLIEFCALVSFQGVIVNKNPENGPKLLNKVKKIIKDQIFFHKIKNAQNVWFPHKYSISSP